MVIVYTDKDWLDLGIVDCAQLDYDCAGDKDFELTVETGGIGLEKHSLWYTIGTEYLGIVEGVEADSNEDTVTYTGTNTRGLLAKKVIETSQEVTSYSGKASEIITGWLTACDCLTLFSCEDSDMEIPEYKMTAYTDVYTAITQMLKQVNAVATFTVGTDRKVHIGVDLRDDYSDRLTYQGIDTYTFKIAEGSNAYNHMICKSAEDSGKRYVLHLFTDENGGVQPYANADQPLQDNDYILDKRNQLITGADERTYLYETDVSTTENYILTTSRPSNWSTHYDDYYTNDDGSYSNVESVEQEVYTKLTSKPKDWNTSYSNYYTKTSTVDGGQFSNVSGSEENLYKALTSMPWDWVNNYGIYYEKDGGTYKSVGSVSVTVYKLQTTKPKDWAKNYKSYYTISNKKYTAVKGIGKKKTTAPKWKKKKYYTKSTYQKTPTWAKGKYYYAYSQKTVIPAWKTNLYYSKFVLQTAPSWTQGKYYRQVLDHYAGMVEGALQELEGLSPSNSAEITIEDCPCRIGDIVGCVDNRSGLEICEEVTNIVFKLKDGIEEFDYEIGGD